LLTWNFGTYANHLEINQTNIASMANFDVSIYIGTVLFNLLCQY